MFLTCELLGVVTGRPGCLLVWDVRLPDPVKIVRLGKEDPPAPIRAIRSERFVNCHLRDSGTGAGMLRISAWPLFNLASWDIQK